MVRIDRRRIAALLLAALPAAVLAHGDAGHARHAGPVVKEQKPWGIAGERAAARRRIEVGMSDDMRFTPARIEVRQGETVRFVFRNRGQTLHEFVLGTKAVLEEHAALMMKFPDMEHDEPYMAHVAPGTSGEIVWTFNRAGEFDFACLIPGHYQAGMVGQVVVTPATQRSR
ncbi:MAG TPA: cupredoxin family protein [Piscinibacter sp.]|uniref:cupredoxin domain-containing protein n=1 Tax=Piscinibacter sp. TaxID=1903157 RepID=UPI002C753AF2|nr:cupredoxin family protein [Piscinibacter sp.]HNK17400.1 cupredoxin family protein [Piscinibacter sp.]